MLNYFNYEYTKELQFKSKFLLIAQTPLLFYL